MLAPGMDATALVEARKRSVRVTVGALLVIAFFLLLFFAQVLTGTPIGFAVLVLMFNALAAATVQMVGGPLTLPGFSVIVLAFQHVTFSQCVKVFFVQDATDRLLRPYETMTVYVLAMLGILVGAVVYKVLRVDRVKPLFEPEEDLRRLNFLAITLTILSVVRLFLLQRFGVYEGGGVYVGGFVGPLRQFGFISMLAVSAGTAAVILKSKGQRCAGLWNSLAILGPILFGILGAGRQDAVSSVVTFLFTLWAFKFKIRIWHVTVFLMSAYAFLFILFPYALYARNKGEVRQGTFEERIQKSINLLTDVALNPGKYQEEESKISPQLPWSFQRMYYFGAKIPTVDRYSVINVTDNIVNAVIMRGPQGGQTAVGGFLMLLPRFLNPEKEALGTSNEIAHYGDGLVNEGDFYTQITMGMIPDAFYCFKYAGAFFLPMLVAFGYFSIYRLLFRPTMMRNIFVIAFMFINTWIFSESTLQGQTLLILQTPMYYVFSIGPLILFGRSLTKRNIEAKYVYERGAAGRDEGTSLPPAALSSEG
ncbi:MAG: hypothetical protein JSS66_04490 [Armatimonadetes bacterium]|nr:hypothetical protein [Armatimonadota bacterium]